MRDSKRSKTNEQPRRKRIGKMCLRLQSKQKNHPYGQSRKQQNLPEMTRLNQAAIYLGIQNHKMPE